MVGGGGDAAPSRPSHSIDPEQINPGMGKNKQQPPSMSKIIINIIINYQIQ